MKFNIDSRACNTWMPRTEMANSNLKKEKRKSWKMMKMRNRWWWRRVIIIRLGGGLWRRGGFWGQAKEGRKKEKMMIQSCYYPICSNIIYPNLNNYWHCCAMHITCITGSITETINYKTSDIINIRMNR